MKTDLGAGGHMTRETREHQRLLALGSSRGRIGPATKVSERVTAHALTSDF